MGNIISIHQRVRYKCLVIATWGSKGSLSCVFFLPPKLQKPSSHRQQISL